MTASLSDRSNKRLVLFDLDGVLLDSSENMRLSWQQACKQVGISVAFDQYFKLIGRPFATIVSMLGLSNYAAELEASFRVASMENIGVLRFYPGVRDALQQLDSAGVKLGVVTSKDPLRTSAILAMLPIEFVCVETPNAVLRGKPAPDHLLMAIARTNVDPAETVYIGDMDVDHQAAMRAGVDYMHAAWGYGNIPDNRTPVVADMREFMELILPAGKRKKGSQ